MENEDKHILCPVCGNRVTNNPKDNLFQIESIDSDFRIHTGQDDLLDDWLLICHNCYYIDHDFSIVPENIQEVQSFVESNEYLNNFADNNPTTYELFDNYLRILNVKKGSAYLFADAYLRISWLYDDNKMTEKADEKREKAIQYFGKTILESTKSDKNQSLLYYYIAELSRRKGEFKRAKKALNNMDNSIKEIKQLYEFQNKLIDDKNKNSVKLPKGVKNYEKLS
ncbi:MAG: DUF2225 domain-containing protein [Candidatus Marinimicrobia bacterium]|nr:DUF2225 domain-containing protein [Candidatus Neomarinimicrobiota bacterium]